MKRARRNRRGYVFIQALILVAGLVALMAMLAADERAMSNQIQQRLAQRRADAAARSAVAKAMAVLSTQTTSVVKTGDPWAQQGTGGGDEFQLGDGGETFRYEIVDCGSLINLNTASAQQLQQLPLDQAQIDSLLDWRETASQPRADGAKDEYYTALTQPYNAKLGSLTTVDELLLIKNWTGQTLYQAPTTQSTTAITLPTDPNGVALPLASLVTVDSGAPNTASGGGALINLGRRGVDVNALIRVGVSRTLATQIAARAPFTGFSALSQLQGMNTSTLQLLLNNVTFTTNSRLTGKINLNTAQQAVLQTVPNLSQSLASAIVAHQGVGFNRLGDIATLQGVTRAQLGQIADSFTVGGDTWLVRAYGASGESSVAVEAVVGIRSGQAQVIDWDRLHTAGAPPAWWDWDAQTTTTMDAGTSQ